MISNIETEEVLVKCKWYVLTAIALFVVALGLLLYPLVGELLSEKYHSDIETSYTTANNANFLTSFNLRRFYF